ncbi:MAG: hypothetical protein ACRCZD_21235 [Phycicoccus sp.]
MSPTPGRPKAPPWRRALRPVVLAYLVLSVLAAGLQGLLGPVHPAWYAVLAAVTTFAARGNPHRWTLALVTVHLVLQLARGAPHGPAGWVTVAALATVLGALHRCAPWLPWRQHRLRPSTATVTGWTTQAGTVLATASATAATAAVVVAPDGAGPALAALALAGIVGVAIAEARRRLSTPSET